MTHSYLSSAAMRRPWPQLLGVAAWLATGTAVVAVLALQAMAQPAPTSGPAARVAPNAAGAAAPAAPSPATNPNPVPATTMAHSCAACHGTNGQLGDEFFKPLAGMPVPQFVRTMADFREGRRPATLMGHVARGFTDADFQAMGEFFAAQQPLGVAVATKGSQP